MDPSRIKGKDAIAKFYDIIELNDSYNDLTFDKLTNDEIKKLIRLHGLYAIKRLNDFIWKRGAIFIGQIIRENNLHGQDLRDFVNGHENELHAMIDDGSIVELLGFDVYLDNLIKSL